MCAAVISRSKLENSNQLMIGARTALLVGTGAVAIGAAIGTLHAFAQRVLDSQPDLRYTTALTALTQCIVADALENDAPRGPYNQPLAEENKWRACRHGMDAAFYDADEDATVPARDVVRGLVERLKPHSQDLGCEAELESINQILESGTGSQRQREVYENSGDFLDVVAFLIEGTRPALAEEQS